MRNIVKSVALGAICATAAIAMEAGDAQAGVINVVPKAVIDQSAPIEQVHYRHHHWRHHHHWRPVYYGRHVHYYGRPWRHRHYRYVYYPRRYYYPAYYPWFNPAGAIAGAAVGLATAPFWALAGAPYWW